MTSTLNRQGNITFHLSAFVAAMQQICKKMELIDLDKDTIDAKVLDSLGVTMENFRFALGSSNPSPRDPYGDPHKEQHRWPREGQTGTARNYHISCGASREIRQIRHVPVQRSGPLGTDKMLLAKAITNECQANFISIKILSPFALEMS
jgi:transitional endoplasmic reticulum ATPase